MRYSWVAALRQLGTAWTTAQLHFNGEQQEITGNRHQGRHTLEAV